MKRKALILPLAGLALAVSGATGFIAVAHADTPAVSSAASQGAAKRTPPAAMGTVTAIAGDTITLSDTRANATYTVDASAATVTKSEKPATAGTKPTSTTITVSDIAVGDMLMVEGTKNGSDVTATAIHDGMMFGGGRGQGPGVMGTVSKVDGSTLTVTGKDGTTYTVDATGATATKMQTIDVSDISVGDTVGVQGTVSGSSVAAKSIMDGMKRPEDASK